jgi:hypothetical protein
MPEGNFGSSKNRTSTAKAACAWNSYGTAEEAAEKLGTGEG